MKTPAKKFDEAALEAAIIKLFTEQGFPYRPGAQLSIETNRDIEQVIIEDDLRTFLARQYRHADITQSEINAVVKQLTDLPASDLYESNKTFCKWLSDGFLLKREDRNQKDLYIQLIDYANVEANQKQLLQPMLLQSGDSVEGVAEVSGVYLQGLDSNIYKVVNQLEIEGPHGQSRIPDLIVYINGLPVVVCEFKSAIREEATIFEAFNQLATTYKRDIPQLFIYNAFCVISDGVNNKMGSLFAPYEFFYAWRKVHGNESVEKDGIDSLHTMLQGLFNKIRLRDVIRNFIYFPDGDKSDTKILCRYPQYYAANKLYQSILLNRKPLGNGKGGTYFGATGCGKSFTMQFLVRLLMKSVEFESPTIVLITDRTDLDDQLAKQFGKAKTYIGDETIQTVESRADLRAKLKGRNSGGVFLTTIHKFSEDVETLSDRSNIICISDEAHRSQTNLDQKVTVTETTVKRSFGFAKHLHDSLPNATYVGFTGTPIDATLDVFGQVVDSYTMTESVKDEITVPIVYEGRAAKVILDNSKLKEIEDYYQQCADAGSNEHQIEQSKKASANMKVILGDPERICALAKDFVAHYEKRIEEGSTMKGKAMFVSSSREIAYEFYKELKALRPQWFEVQDAEDIANFSESERKKAIKNGKLATPSERVKMVMTRVKGDDKILYEMLGTKENRKELDRQFKIPASNFKIAIVVDMWLTGFDVPFLDTIYIDKPLQKHNLIQTISRVNRKFESKDKGLVVDYIGIKKQMNQALAKYAKSDGSNFEDIAQSLIVVKDHLDLLARLFHNFDASGYFTFEPLAQLDCLNKAAEYVSITQQIQQRFMALVKRLKAAYDVCCGSEELTEQQRDFIHFYLAVRSVVFKRTKGDAPDTAQMNAKVRELISEALKSDGVEEIYKLGNEDGAINIFDEDYIDKINKIELPNTKIQLLQKLLEKALSEFKKVNQVQSIDFSKRLQALVDKYNERKEEDIFNEDFKNIDEQYIALYRDLLNELDSGGTLGIDVEEKAFYDILSKLAAKYDFSYPEDKLIELAKAVKVEVDDKAKYPDWHQRTDIKAKLKVDLIILLAKHGYPPVDRDEVYKDIFEQAENFKKHRNY